jgi:hypothetical protein
MEDVMDSLIFSQIAIFRMQQLVSCFYHKTGIRHRMATQDGMLALMRDASSSTDSDIRLYYDAFVMELDNHQLDMLEAHNVAVRKPFYASMTPIRKAS